jgi:hypothetical protein
MTEQPRDSAGDEPAETVSYDLGFTLGKALRFLTGRSEPATTFALLLVLVVGTIASVIVGAVAPEHGHGWYVLATASLVLLGAAIAAISLRSLPVLAAGLYVVATDVGIVARDNNADWALWIIGLTSIAAGLVFMRSIVESVRSEKELERVINTDATSIAFFAVMLSALTYALLETYMDLPRVSMWLVWTVGMGTWAVMSFVVRRRFT